MSDPISHECGIAVVRLKKPLGYFYQKYGTALFGLDALQALMTKQRNRGQDGAGMATGCIVDVGHSGTKGPPPFLPQPTPSSSSSSSPLLLFLLCPVSCVDDGMSIPAAR